MERIGTHPLVLAALRQDMGEAEFKLRRLESELNTVPAGARSTMGHLRLTKRVAEAETIYRSWQRVVARATTTS